MADNLTTLSTESLTAAVTSLLRKPLPDINVHISSPVVQGTAIPTRQDFQTTLMPQHHQYAQQTSLPSVITIPQSETSQQIISQTSPHTSILNKSQQTASNRPKTDETPADKKLKFSVENLHLHSSDTELTATQPLVIDEKSHSAVENSFQTLQGLSALQNILNSYPLYNHANNTSGSLDSMPIPSNQGQNVLPYTSSTQALQQLYQSLFSPSEPSIQPTQTLQQAPGLQPAQTLQQAPSLQPAQSTIYQSTSIDNGLNAVSNVSSEQNLGNSSFVSNQQNVPQRLLSQTLSTGNLAEALQSTCTSRPTPDQLPHAPAEDLSSVIKGSTLQQFPFLVQPSSQGGPVQLIPIGASLDLPLIQMLQKQNTKSSTVPVSQPDTVSPVCTAVTIQPKPSTLSLQSLLSQTGSTSTRTTPVLDLNLLHNILNSQLARRVNDLPEPLPPLPPYQVSDPIPNLPVPATTLDTQCGQDVSVQSSSAEVPTSQIIHPSQSQPQCQSIGISTDAHTVDLGTSTQTGGMTDSVPQHTVNSDNGTGYDVPSEDNREFLQEEQDDSHTIEEHQVEETDCHDDPAPVTTELPSQTDNTQPNPGVFCTVCYKLYQGSCKAHSTDYVYVQDTPILTRARASLPKCFYLHQTSTTDLKDCLGIWCKEYISERTLFGPVIGEMMKIQTSAYTQQSNGFNPYKLCTVDDECEVLCLDDERVCNWMMFLRPARSLMEQNCVMYRDGDRFYLITTIGVKEEEELLMWFSPDLCQNLGINQDPENTKLTQCDQCGMYFTTKKLLTIHLKSVHPDRFKHNWTCPMCAKKFSSNSKLNNHMMLHMGLKPHRCTYCNKQFSDASNLKTHILIHTGQKKYKCETCDKTFRQKAHLDVHYIVHTGTKKFKCSYCDKCFARQADLKTHTYRHTQEMSYTCQVCGKMFYKTQNYKKHLKVHTGERNYMCNKCFKGFQTKYHRDRHLKICKEKNGKESSYMSLEEVAGMGNTYEIPLKNVREGNSVEHAITDNGGEES